MKKISDVLKHERVKKDLTLDDVSKATKIRREFLEAIEEGYFTKLPSESYALGFVKNYAQYLDISGSYATALFRREYAKEKQEVLPTFRKEHNRFSKKEATKRLIIIIAISIPILAFIFFQYGSLFLAPKLSILSPKNGDEISESVVRVVGKTDQYAQVFVEGDSVMVELDGSFSKSLFVTPGDKKIIVIAKNKFGREAKQTLSITVK